MNESALKMIKKTKKCKDLFDKSTLEFWVSTIMGVLMMLLSFFISVTSGPDIFVAIVTDLINDILVAFIGLLAFILAGISAFVALLKPKVIENVNKIDDGKKDIEYLGISFYFLGLIISFIILGSIILYILAKTTLPAFTWTNVLISLLYGYFVTFALMYCLKMISLVFRFFMIFNFNRVSK